jgi:MFS family permease
MVDAYILVFAGLLLTMGAMGDRFGRKLAFNAGLLVFAAASAASTLAGSPEILIAARAAMGIGAALIMPATLSIITNIFPPSERGRAIGIWTGMAGLGIMLGPIIGGWLLEHYWWGSGFLINLPVVALAILAGRSLGAGVPRPQRNAAGPDRGDAVRRGLGRAGLRHHPGAGAGGDRSPDPGRFSVAAVLSAAFVWWERHVQHPMLPMEFFGNPRFSAASGAIATAFLALFGSVFLLTQHLQFVLGYTPLQDGVRVLPVAALIVAAPLTERIGTKLVVAAGLLGRAVRSGPGCGRLRGRGGR